MSLHAIKLTDRDLYLNSAGKSHRIGIPGETSDGRLFRYALEGGNAIAANMLCESRATGADWDTITLNTTTKPIDTKINVTAKSTLAIDELENGYLVCETDPNSNTGPNCWRIHGNEAAGSDAFNIYLAEGATIGQILAAGTDTMIYSHSPWSGIIVSPNGAPTGLAVGVTMIAIGANRYCWLQTKGICGVRMQAVNLGVGEGIVADGGNAGNVENVTVSAVLQVIAQTLTVQGLTGDNVIPVFLTIE